MPEADIYLKTNEERMKLANRTNAYGGGGSFGWAPNLKKTGMKEKPQEAKKPLLKKSRFEKSPKKENKPALKC